MVIPITTCSKQNWYYNTPDSNANTTGNPNTGPIAKFVSFWPTGTPHLATGSSHLMTGATHLADRRGFPSDRRGHLTNRKFSSHDQKASPDDRRYLYRIAAGIYISKQGAHHHRFVIGQKLMLPFFLRFLNFNQGILLNSEQR